MVHDHPLLSVGLTRQLFWIAEGTESGRAYVPVGNVDSPDGTRVRGAASKVLVML